MADRHNLCINPCLTNDNAGWGGGAAPTRTTVSGFGRTTAARYEAGTFASTPATNVGGITEGQTYTVSLYLRTASFNVGGGAIYIEWINGAGGGFGYPSASFTLTAGVVGRASVTATAPTGAVAARAIVDGINYTINITHMTMVLIEQAVSLQDYFDGDSPGASWDGSAGNSSSTLPGGSQVTGEVSQTITALATAAGANAASAATTSTTTADITAAAAVAGAGASLTAVVVAVADATVTRPSDGGSWYQLLDIVQEAAAAHREDRDRVPTACPNDGEPLRAGPRGVLHCPFDGWTYPRDWRT